MTTDHRYTTNSRGPGQQGVPVETYTFRRELIRCECGAWRWADVEPHAPRLTNKGRVDCMGRST